MLNGVVKISFQHFLKLLSAGERLWQTFELGIFAFKALEKCLRPFDLFGEIGRPCS